MTPPSNDTANRSSAAARGDVPARPGPAGLEQRLLARARAAGLKRGDRVIVGFSGGRDSLALASGLRRSRDALGIEVRLIHVDHGLRAESGTEAERAETLAEWLGLGYRGVVLAENPVELHPHVGLEEAARRERYRLLFAIAHEWGAWAVATGHQQQDQAETVMLHLVRGSGVHGAAGMGEVGANPCAPEAAGSRDISHEPVGKPPRLWRPLLREPRSAIDAYVAQLGLAWNEDPTNSDRSLRRNAVRHEILPLLEAHFPGTTASLARYADLAAADDEMLQEMAEAALVGAVDPGGRLAAAALAARHHAMQRRIVRCWLIQETGRRDVSLSRIEAVLDLARSGRGNRAVEVGGGWTVGLRHGMLRAGRLEQEGEGEA